MRRWRAALATAGVAAAGLLLLDRASPPDLSRWRDRSVVVEARDGSVLHSFTTRDGKWRLSGRRAEVDQHYLAILLAAEDHRFAGHWGIDPLALGRAAWQFGSSGRVISGGSTLTMQVARLLEPHRRSIPGKLHDMVRAVQLEERYGKDEILAMYLTLAPFGGNLEGVRAASLAYFGHEPSTLSPGEAAVLVALPRQPARLRPDRHPQAAARAAERLIARLIASHDLPTDAADTVWPEIAARRAFPSAARHVAERLKSRADPDGRVRTTLDPELQRATEAFAAREVGWAGDSGDMAGIVVDNRQHAVRAWVGGVRSALDLARARRSPGSALKPFIYGLAFDDLAIVPETLVEDRPLSFGGWAPEDFDHSFRGQVTASEALQQSHNLPAVQLLERVGPGRFSAALRAAGARLAFPKDGSPEPSLPLALGGVGIDLQDLTRLYAALAAGGRVHPMQVLADAPPGPLRPALMSEHAAALVTAILREAPPPDGRVAPEAADGGRPIAFKTGTSYGFRDAWAVGYTPGWTVGIWTGRSDGTPRPGAYGRNTAAPLLFAVFDMLPAEGDGQRSAARSEPPATRTPAGLREFAAGAAGRALPGMRPPRILYPPQGAVIDVRQPDGARQALALEAEGGTPPYRWSIDGRPLPPAPGYTLPTWQPDGPGFARITVLDGAGRHASATVRLE